VSKVQIVNEINNKKQYFLIFFENIGFSFVSWGFKTIKPQETNRVIGSHILYFAANSRWHSSQTSGEEKGCNIH